MKAKDNNHILKTEEFSCPVCGNNFLIFSDRVKRYIYKKQNQLGDNYYCRYNCWIKR